MPRQRRWRFRFDYVDGPNLGKTLDRAGLAVGVVDAAGRLRVFRGLRPGRAAALTAAECQGRGVLFLRPGLNPPAEGDEGDTARPVRRLLAAAGMDPAGRPVALVFGRPTERWLLANELSPAERDEFAVRQTTFVLQDPEAAGAEVAGMFVIRRPAKRPRRFGDASAATSPPPEPFPTKATE